jgi:hypothetical protein
LYRRHDIWCRIDDDQLACYRAFEDLGTGEFFVQSKDFFWRSGSDSLTTQVQRSEAQLVDLIGRDVPVRRTYPTIQEAIEAHEKLWSAS